MMSSASCSVAVGVSVIGSVIMPDSERLTISTSLAWASGDMVAVNNANAAFARQLNRQRASVTVSIAAERIGIFSWIVRVSRARTSTSEGSTSL
jgi:hypothetical protein